MNKEELARTLCKSLCSEVTLHEREVGLYFVETPFAFPDGDHFVIYIQALPGAKFRITDRAHTMLHLSYSNDVNAFFQGTRGRLREMILESLGLEERNGEFFIVVSSDEIGEATLKFAEALIRITDLTFLNRARVESTFFEDLQELLFKTVPAEKIHPDYVVPELKSDLYKIDYMIDGKDRPLFLFGINSSDKARLATITLERLEKVHSNYDSLLVFADQAALPRQDLARLSNVGGEQISSLDAYDEFERKILKKVGTNGQYPR
jgi:hypothetical protein